MVATLLRPPLDALVLPAGEADAFGHAASASREQEGLRPRL